MTIETELAGYPVRIRFRLPGTAKYFRPYKETEADEETLYVTDEDLARLSQKYDHARPFTKESLLYREIFEKYYPGQGQMIVDFWMPNKSWEGCDVDDPSARVLSNYGDSGK